MMAMAPEEEPFIQTSSPLNRTPVVGELECSMLLYHTIHVLDFPVLPIVERGISNADKMDVPMFSSLPGYAGSAIYLAQHRSVLSSAAYLSECIINKCSDISSIHFIIFQLEI